MQEIVQVLGVVKNILLVRIEDTIIVWLIRIDVVVSINRLCIV